MTIRKQFYSNFTKGEVSDLVGARPDLQSYFNGVGLMENFLVYPEGGATTEGTGLRWLFPAKYSDRKALLLEFTFNVTQTYVFEVGDFYTRIFNGIDTTFITELVTPWQVFELADLDWKQSADVLFVTHGAHQTRQINRVSHNNWTVTLFEANPPASFEADTDISQGVASITPSAVAGNITITASSGVFLAGDVGKQLIAGQARAILKTFTDTSHMDATVLTAFPNTNPVPSGSWFVRGSPGSTLDVNKVGPVGAEVTLVASVPTWRAQDGGKFVKVYGGVIRIITVPSPTSIPGEIVVPLTESDVEDPPIALAGAWTLEESSWSDARGWPSLCEFHQGRFVLAATDAQPTTVWLSAVDDYLNFGEGVEADAALEYTIASRRVNRLRWLVSMGHLFVGDAEREYIFKGPGVDAPLGGDTVPYVKDQGDSGSMRVRPLVVSNSILFIDRVGAEVDRLSYSFDDDAFTPDNVSILARHIGEMGFAQHAPAFAKKPYSIAYFLLANGHIATFTYHRKQEVMAWSRLLTHGLFESFCVTPTATGYRLWVLVHRVINGNSVRYIEFADEFVFTHAAKTGTIGTGTTHISGLNHLEGQVVDVKLGGSYMGQRVVSSGGSVELQGPINQDLDYEVGLHHEPRIRTLRPAVGREVLEGYTRQWVQVCLRVKGTVGAKVDEMPLRPLTKDRPYTGLAFASPRSSGNDYDGTLDIVQTQPYNTTILTIAGTVEFSDGMG